MGRVHRGSATTTHAVRGAIQRSQASLAQLSRELGINPKSVAMWRKRATVEDLKTGPKEPWSTVLTEAEEAVIVACRRHAPLALSGTLCGRRCSYTTAKRSPNMMANCAFASNHSRGGRFQSSLARFRTRYSSLVGASSLGKCPRVRTARRSFEFKASIAFVV